MKDEWEEGREGGRQGQSCRLAEQPGQSEKSLCCLLGNQNQRGWWEEMEMEGSWLWLIPFGFVFLLELIYSPEEWFFTFMVFYAGLIRHRSPWVGKEIKKTINMFYSDILTGKYWETRYL